MEKNTKYKTQNTNRGITLVALIITIIVLLILAMVSIRLVMNGGIIGRAENGTKVYSVSEEKEQIQLGVKEFQMAQFEGGAQLKVEGAEVTPKNEGGWTVALATGRTYNVTADGTITGGEKLTYISKTASENFVGYYADVNADGTVDGVIFADMLVGNTKSVASNTSNKLLLASLNLNMLRIAAAEIPSPISFETDNYTIPTISANELKSYYISEKNYNGIFGKKDVLSPVGEGKNRFYVMSLSDIDTNTHYWYHHARGNMDDYETATSEKFGTGKKNTENMIAKWDKGEVSNGGYGEQDSNDMWGLIKTQVSEGWFVPSRGEWLAFTQELGITSSNYIEYNLSDFYGSSSQADSWYVWCADFRIGSIERING